jgi:iron-sulfur cluster repair protein YtfE (RIC family)
MEITELLKKEHAEVSDLFQQFFGGGTITRLVNKVVGTRPPRRKAVALKICDVLDLHARLEEDIFYPEVRATGDDALNKQIDEAVREHAGVKAKIAQARALLGDEERLEETMSAIQGDDDHHVREEETEMFPLLHKVMSNHKLEEIGRRYAASKRASKGAQRVTVSRQAGKSRKTASGRTSRTTPARAGKRATTQRRKASVAAAKRKTPRSKPAAAARRKTRSTKARSTQKRARRLR